MNNPETAEPQPIPAPPSEARPPAQATAAPMAEQRGIQTLRYLIDPVRTIAGSTSIAEAWAICKEENRDFLPVDAEGQILGLCSFSEIGFLVATAADPVAFLAEPIHNYLVPNLLVLPVNTTVSEALQAAFSRQGASFSYDLVIVDDSPAASYLGLISLRTLVDLQSQQVSDQFEALAKKEEMLRNALTLQFKNSVEMRHTQESLAKKEEMLRNALTLQFKNSVEMRRSQAQYHALFQNSPVGVALMNNSGETKTYNRHFAGLLQLPPPSNDPALIDLGDFMPLSSRAEFLSALQQLERVPENAVPPTLELPMEIGGGEARFRLTLSWISESAQICLCAVDVTEERLLQKKILQQEKDVLLDSLLGGVAHELNNKALPLLGFSELLSTEATEGRDPEKITHYTEVIKKSSAEFAAVVHQLLQLVKPGGKPTPVSLLQVIRETLFLLAHTINDSKVTVIEQLPEQDVAVIADPHHLKQILLNLALNAVEAMKKSFRKELLIRLRTSGNQIVIEVGDTGSGIDPEILPRIFDPFFTSKSAETSRGLGLSVSRSLAKQYRGEVQVESKVGEGSTFTVTLPLSRIPVSMPPIPKAVVPALIAQAEPAAAGAEPLPPRILVVDDEENVGSLVKEILRRKLNGQIERAMNGEEAIQQLEKGDFDLILSDVRMPVKNGLEFFRWVAANRPASVPRFLFMTGHDGSNEMSDEIGRSQVPVLRKPFAIDVLIKQCQERLGIAGKA